VILRVGEVLTTKTNSFERDGFHRSEQGEKNPLDQGEGKHRKEKGSHPICKETLGISTLKKWEEGKHQGFLGGKRGWGRKEKNSNGETKEGRGSFANQNFLCGQKSAFVGGKSRSFWGVYL